MVKMKLPQVEGRRSRLWWRNSIEPFWIHWHAIMRLIFTESMFCQPGLTAGLFNVHTNTRTILMKLFPTFEAEIGKQLTGTLWIFSRKFLEVSKEISFHKTKRVIFVLLKIVRRSKITSDFCKSLEIIWNDSFMWKNEVFSETKNAGTLWKKTLLCNKKKKKFTRVSRNVKPALIRFGAFSVVLHVFSDTEYMYYTGGY